MQAKAWSTAELQKLIAKEVQEKYMSQLKLINYGEYNETQGKFILENPLELKNNALYIVKIVNDDETDSASFVVHRENEDTLCTTLFLNASDDATTIQIYVDNTNTRIEIYNLNTGFDDYYSIIKIYEIQPALLTDIEARIQEQLDTKETNKTIHKYHYVGYIDLVTNDGEDNDFVLALNFYSKINLQSVSKQDIFNWLKNTTPEMGLDGSTCYSTTAGEFGIVSSIESTTDTITFDMMTGGGPSPYPVDGTLDSCSITNLTTGVTLDV